MSLAEEADCTERRTVHNRQAKTTGKQSLPSELCFARTSCCSKCVLQQAVNPSRPELTVPQKKKAETGLCATTCGTWCSAVPSSWRSRLHAEWQHLMLHHLEMPAFCKEETNGPVVTLCPSALLSRMHVAEIFLSLLKQHLPICCSASWRDAKDGSSWLSWQDSCNLTSQGTCALWCFTWKSFNHRKKNRGFAPVLNHR